MISRAFVFAVSLVGLAACELPTAQSVVAVSQDESAALVAALSGKSLVIGDDVFNANADGTLTGVAGPSRTNFVGTWEIVDGQWCRDFTEPAAFAGRECQEAVLGDGTVTITGGSGPRTWAVQ